MKKAGLYKVVMVLTTVLLTGCGSAKTESAQKTEERTLLSDITFTSESNYGEDYFHTGSSNYMTKGDDGQYYCIDRNEYCIKVINPETGESRVPCDKPGCDHIHNCDAHIDSLQYAVESLYAYQGHLYVIRATNGVFTLEQMDMDGSNRISVGTLSKMKAGAKTIDYTVVFYDGCVYYCALNGEIYGEDNDNSVFEMSLTTGEKKGIIKRSELEGKYATVMKVYGNRLFFLAGERKIVKNGDETGVQNDYIGLYEYDTKNETVIPVVKGNISGYAFDVKEQKLYYSIIQEGIFCMDLQTKQESKLVAFHDDYPYAYELSVDTNNIYTIINNRKRGEDSENDRFALAIYDKTGSKVRSLAFYDNRSYGKICYGDADYLFLEKNTYTQQFFVLPKSEIANGTWKEIE